MNEKRYFQWVVGERRGEILVFDKIETDDEDLYILFKDNSRIKESLVAALNHYDLTGKMMAEIDHPNNGWRFEEKIISDDDSHVAMDWESQTKYDVPSVTEIMSDGQKLPTRKKQIKMIPPKRTAPKTSNFGVISNPVLIEPEIKIETPVINKTISKEIDTTDPVYIMMSKAKKVDNDVEMKITISMPNKSLYNVAEESFDEGGKKVVEYIIENIDVNDIKDALKDAITTMYKTRVISPVSKEDRVQLQEGAGIKILES